MSRKGQKKEEESLGGKVLTGIAVGVAVAAAGAAIGYFGRHFLNAWQEANLESEQGAVGNTVESSCVSKLCAENDSEGNGRKDDHKPLEQKALNVESSSPDKSGNVSLAKSVTLHDQLMDYYHNYVHIPPKDMADTHKIMDEIHHIVNYHLRDPKFLGMPMLKIGDLVQFGSVLEGLAVVRPEMFDIMVPVKLMSNCQVRSLGTSMEESSGLVYIKVQPGDASSAKSCDLLCDHNHRLLARKLASSLLAAFQHACSKTRFNVTVVLNDSSITATVKHLNGRTWTSVNFVPAILVDSKLFLPNPASSVLAGTDDASSFQWLSCYSRQEQWSVDRFDSSINGHRIALQILKAIRLNHLAQFGQISSYHIKHLLFHVLDDLPDSSDWHEAAVGERLIDLLARLTQALNEQYLPHYFEQSVNLLASVSKDDCAILAKFIEKKLGHNDIASLLEKHYGTTS